MGKLILKRLLILCTLFTLGARQNSEPIQDKFCGGASVVDAATLDASSILTHTDPTIATWENCKTVTNSLNVFNRRSWNATWIDSGQKELSSPPQLARLARFGQKSCLVTFAMSFTFDKRLASSLSSESFTILLNG